MVRQWRTVVLRESVTRIQFLMTMWIFVKLAEEPWSAVGIPCDKKKELGACCTQRP